MTQEDKELLMQDLCARLKYDVKVLYSNKVFSIDYISYTYEEIKLYNDYDYYTLNISVVKPYLFPLSSMTEEQEDEWYEVFVDPLSKKLDRHTRQEYLQFQADAQAFGIEYLLKNHFDYRGLIEKGLAIDATGLNIY